MEHLWQIQHSYLIPLLPLIGAIISGFFGARWLKGNSHWPLWIGVGASAIMSLTLLFSVLGLQKGHDAPHAAAEHSAAADSSHVETLSATRTLFHWITAGDDDAAGTKKFFDIPAAFFFDPLTV